MLKGLSSLFSLLAPSAATPSHKARSAVHADAGEAPPRNRRRYSLREDEAHSGGAGAALTCRRRWSGWQESCCSGGRSVRGERGWGAEPWAVPSPGTWGGRGRVSPGFCCDPAPLPSPAALASAEQRQQNHPTPLGPPRRARLQTTGVEGDPPVRGRWARPRTGRLHSRLCPARPAAAAAAAWRHRVRPE